MLTTGNVFLTTVNVFFTTVKGMRKRRVGCAIGKAAGCASVRLQDAPAAGSKLCTKPFRTIIGRDAQAADCRILGNGLQYDKGCASGRFQDAQAAMLQDAQALAAMRKRRCTRASKHFLNIF